MVELGTHSRKTQKSSQSLGGYIHNNLQITYILHSDNKYIHMVALSRMQFSMNTVESIDRFLCLSWSCLKT